MHPILIDLGPLSIYSFGFFIVASFLLGMGWTMREARLKGLDSSLVLDMGFYVLLGGLLGARLSYATLNPGPFLHDPLAIFKLWQGGMVFMGGVLVAAAFTIIYLKIQNQKILPWLDAAAPGLCLGLAAGWLGCLAAGCGYGRPADLAWAVTYTHPEAIGPLFTALHPTQAYHALAALTCFLVIMLVKKNLRSPGRLAGLFLIMYSLLRTLIDFYRDDLSPDLVFLSLNQALGLAMVAVGLVLFYLPGKHVKK
jgi:phosphatidylglycerol---prolipoprotein diacylglyceryl transferase